MSKSVEPRLKTYSSLVRVAAELHKSPVTEQYCSVTQEEDRSKELVLFAFTDDR